jgi:hypothetical protein
MASNSTPDDGKRIMDKGWEKVQQKVLETLFFFFLVFLFFSVRFFLCVG